MFVFFVAETCFHIINLFLADVRDMWLKSKAYKSPTKEKSSHFILENWLSPSLSDDLKKSTSGSNACGIFLPLILQGENMKKNSNVSDITVQSKHWIVLRCVMQANGSAVLWLVLSGSIRKHRSTRTHSSETGLLFALKQHFMNVFTLYYFINKGPVEMLLKWSFMSKACSAKLWLCCRLCWSRCRSPSLGKPRRQQLFMRKTKRQESVNGSNPLWQTNTHTKAKKHVRKTFTIWGPLTEKSTGSCWENDLTSNSRDDFPQDPAKDRSYTFWSMTDKRSPVRRWCRPWGGPCEICVFPPNSVLPFYFFPISFFWSLF